MHLCRDYSKMYEKDERLVSHKDLDNEHDGLLVCYNINLQWERDRTSSS